MDNERFQGEQGVVRHYTMDGATIPIYTITESEASVIRQAVTYDEYWFTVIFGYNIGVDTPE